MTPEEVRAVVMATLDELEKRSQLRKDCYHSILQKMDKRLYGFFSKKEPKEDKELRYILTQLSDDQYIDIIYLQYRDKVTMERIAEALEKDVSTIKRNKKRLIMSIYKQMEE